MKYLSTLEEKFCISERPYNILYCCCSMQVIFRWIVDTQTVYISNCFVNLPVLKTPHLTTRWCLPLVGRRLRERWYQQTNKHPFYLMDDVVVPWAFRGTRSLTHSLSHSLTHSITHSILINLFINVRLNTLLLPPLLSITFVPSAFYAYVWHILESTSKACIFSDTKD